MTMNCKQFKHVERVEKKQQFSFNPAEVDYNNSIINEDELDSKKVIVRDVSLKRMGLYLIIAIVVLSFVASQLN